VWLGTWRSFKINCCGCTRIKLYFLLIENTWKCLYYLLMKHGLNEKALIYWTSGRPPPPLHPWSTKKKTESGGRRATLEVQQTNFINRSLIISVVPYGSEDKILVSSVCEFGSIYKISWTSLDYEPFVPYVSISRVSHVFHRSVCLLIFTRTVLMNGCVFWSLMNDSSQNRL